MWENLNPASLLLHSAATNSISAIINRISVQIACHQEQQGRNWKSSQTKHFTNSSTQHQYGIQYNQTKKNQNNILNYSAEQLLSRFILVKV